jgi:hypothetical protein
MVGNGSMFVWLHRRDGGTALAQPWSRGVWPIFPPRREVSLCLQMDSVLQREAERASD